MNKYKSFEELKQARLKAYNGMVEGDVLGFLDQHTGFYPDPAHFIYELLQNAEDMEATEVTFRLFEDRLIFEHNGIKRDFDLNDIDAITNKGKSPKADDPTQIGKFGMGFKAVYVYTNTPEIHSGEYDFRIENVIVPNDDGVSKTAKKNFTQFIFPFDNPNKSATDAVKEIAEEGFNKLNETALLFLTHIKTIHYYLPDGSKGYISIESKIQNIRFLYSISVKKPNVDETVTYWARFSDECPIMVDNKDSNSKAVKSFPISIAYRLIKNEDNKFKLDKKANMLDYAAYSTLPTVRDFNNQPDSRYKIFATRIKEEFEKAELFITDSGKYCSIKDIYNAANKEIKIVLPTEFLEKFYGKSWIPTVYSVTRVEYFIDQFGIGRYSIENFIDSLEKDNHFFDELFLNQTNKEYFKTLYYLFSQSKEREQYSGYYSFLYKTSPARNEILREVNFILCRG